MRDLRQYSCTEYASFIGLSFGTFRCFINSCCRLNESQRKARIVGLRNPAHPSGNQLTSLDCAFLGRLLVALKDELRLKYQLELLEPPHKLPYDFRCVKRLDVVPVA